MAKMGPLTSLFFGLQYWQVSLFKEFLLCVFKGLLALVSLLGFCQLAFLMRRFASPGPTSDGLVGGGRKSLESEFVPSFPF